MFLLHSILIIFPGFSLSFLLFLWNTANFHLWLLKILQMSDSEQLLSRKVTSSRGPQAKKAESHWSKHK